MGIYVLLKIEILHSLENYIPPVCDNVYVYPVKIQSTANAKNYINAQSIVKLCHQSDRGTEVIKKENIKKIEKKRHTVKNKYEEYKESMKQSEKGGYMEN